MSTIFIFKKTLFTDLKLLTDCSKLCRLDKKHTAISAGENPC